MGKENFFIQMAEYTLGHESKIKCKARVFYITHQEKLPMMVNGFKINLKDKEHYIMKSQNNSIFLLISLIWKK